MNQRNIVLKHGINYPINRYDIWEMIVHEWDAILESDVSTYAGFEEVAASSLFDSWLNGFKGTGVIENDFLPYTEVKNTANRVTVHLFNTLDEIISKKQFDALFLPTRYLTRMSLRDALFQASCGLNTHFPYDLNSNTPSSISSYTGILYSLVTFRCHIF